MKRFSIYDSEEFTVLKLIEKFGKILNENTDIANESLNFLSWLKEEGLPVEIEKQVEELYINGGLADLINNIIFGQLNERIDIIDKDYVRVDKFPRLETESEDMPRIQRAIDFAISTGINRVFIPSGKYIVNDTITIPRGFTLLGSGMGYASEKGTILWRDEIVNSKPLIKIGDGNSCPLVKISNMTLVGSSIDQNAHGIFSDTVGLHGFVIEEIQFECFGGTPIKIISSNSGTRAEFGEIRKCHSGFDWGNYKGSEIIRRSTNSICTGVHLNGHIDSVNIMDCVFLGSNKTSGVGLLIDNFSDSIRSGDHFKVSNCSFSGNNIGIDSCGRLNNIENCYLEGNNLGIKLSALGLGTTGGNNTRIINNLFSSCSNCIRIIDNTTSVNRSVHVNIENNYIYTSYTATPNGINFIYADNNANIRGYVMNNNFITSTVGGATGINFFSTTMTQITKNQFNGQNQLDAKVLFLNMNKVLFTPIAVSEVNNLSLFVDSTDNKLKFKGADGVANALY